MGVMKQSSFGSVIYDSSRKTRDGVAFDEQRGIKQASSLSPTRMMQDMSRQDASVAAPLNLAAAAA